MTDHHDQLLEDLTELFDTTAADTEIPPLPLRNVVARGEEVLRVRRRRVATWAAAAAAAAVAVVAVSVPLAVSLQPGHQENQPPPGQTSTTTGPTAGLNGVLQQPLTLPYLDGEELHADGGTIHTNADTILSRGGTTYVSTRKDGVWSHLVRGQLKQVSDSAMVGNQPWLGWHGQALSPDGSMLVVVTYPTQDSTRVIAYRTADDKEIAHTDVAEAFSNWTGGGNSLSLLGVDNTGRIYWVQEFGVGKHPETDWTWQPGHGDPIQLDEPFASQPYGIFDVTPAGPLVGEYILAPSGGRSSAELPTGAVKGAVWAPSGATYARKSGTPAFVTTANGAVVEARVPGTLQRWIGYESETTVLAAVQNGSTTRLVRCVVTSGSCAAVEDLPAGWNKWHWAANGPSSVSSPPPSVDPTPSVPNSPPTVPYVQNGVLHLDGRSIGQGLNRAVASGGTVLALRSTGFHDGGAETLFTSLVDGQRLVPIPALTSVGLSNHEMPYAPYLSADGKTAVATSWLSGAGVRMTAWSIPQRRVLGTLDLTDTEIGAENIAGIESDGTVVYRNPSDQHAYSWLPGHAPRQLDSADSTAINNGTLDVGATDMTIVHGMPNGISALSPDGSAALTVADDGTTSVRDLRTGHGIRMDLPSPVYGTVGFESSTAVLVTTGNEDGGPLVRCSATTGACAQIWSTTKGVTFPRLPGGY